jgi:hypothetical protein
MNNPMENNTIIFTTLSYEKAHYNSKLLKRDAVNNGLLDSS